MRALAIVMLAACSSPSQPTTAVTPMQPAGPHGRVVIEKFHSDALGVDKDVRVYLPAGYEAGGKHYPVLYYLHGLTGDESNWIEHGHLDKVADSLGLQAIVVMPDGDNNFYVDSKMTVDYDACMRDGTGLMLPQQPKAKTCTRTWKYETYITHDLIGWVDKTYRTIPSREGRGVAGLSMGGYGSLMLSMRHPDLFAAAASHSGVDSLLYGGPFPYEHGKGARVDDIKPLIANLGDFGKWMILLYGDDIETWRAYDPSVLVEKLAPGQLKLYLDCGTEDDFALHNGMQYLHDLLLDHHIDHAYYIGPGKHDFVFWSQRLPKSLAFMQQSVAPAR